MERARRFGAYLLLRKVAEGGMAQIYLAKRVGTEGFERDVVLKLMLEALARSKESVEMFLAEARLAAKLSHPNIVQITDLGQIDTSYFICMEYLAGEDLGETLERAKTLNQTIPIEVAAQVALAVCEGLEFAHTYAEGGRSLGIVHRDMTPSNIIVTYQGTVKIVDFGIAKAETNAIRTSQGQLKGKWMYMAPEQARGENLDGRADIFSLGLTLYELLTGKRLFDRESELAILAAVLDSPIPPPRKFRADIPPDLEKIILKAVDRDLKRRYASAGAMRADLEHFLTSANITRSGPALGRYLAELFGEQRAAQKLFVPTLKELEASGLVEPAPPPGVAPPSNSSGPKSYPGQPLPQGAAAYHIPATRGPMSSPGIRPHSRWPAILLGAVGSVILLAVGGTVAMFLRPAVQSQPPPQIGAVVTPVNPVVPGPPPVVVPQNPPATTTNPNPITSAPPVRPPPAQPKLGPLEPPEIKAAVTKHAGRLQGCFERYQAQLGQKAGRVVITATIATTGKVIGSALKGYEGTPLGECVELEMKQVKFRTLRQEGEVTLPFVYQPSTQE
jgi:serine/threonine protein kinase